MTDDRDRLAAARDAATDTSSAVAGRTTGSLRLVRWTTVPQQQLPALWEVYLRAFGGLATRAASRHLMDAEQFVREMTDRRIIKFATYAGDDPIGLLTVTTDLDGIVWVSPEYYRNRYPDKARQVFYVTNMLTDPRNRGREAFDLLTEAACREASGGVLGFDVCGSNVRRGFAEAVARRVCALHAGASTFEELDRQTFYGIDLTGPMSADPATG